MNAPKTLAEHEFHARGAFNARYGKFLRETLLPPFRPLFHRIHAPETGRSLNRTPRISEQKKSPFFQRGLFLIRSETDYFFFATAAITERTFALQRSR